MFCCFSFFKTGPQLLLLRKAFFFLPSCSLFPVNKLIWAIISHHISTQSDFLLFAFCLLVFKPFKLHHHGLIKRLVYWTEFGERLWKSETGFQPVTHQLRALFIRDKNIIKRKILSFGADLITDSCWTSASVSSSMFQELVSQSQFENGSRDVLWADVSSVSMFPTSRWLIDCHTVLWVFTAWDQMWICGCDGRDVSHRRETELHLNQIVSHVRVWCLVSWMWQ